jgi:hypothetical protein
MSDELDPPGRNRSLYEAIAEAVRDDLYLGDGEYTAADVQRVHRNIAAGISSEGQSLRDEIAYQKLQISAQGGLLHPYGALDDTRR